MRVVGLACPETKSITSPSLKICIPKNPDLDRPSSNVVPREGVE